MTDVESRWWAVSVPTPDLRPIFSNECAKALQFVSDGTGVRIRFPWWDTRHEAEPLLAWIRTSSDGDAFNDLDQGWQIDARCVGDRLHFLDRNFDTGEVLANVVVSRTEFLAALDRAEKGPA